ncbi:MAG TPA: hypothetical protein VGE06_05870 [Flavisolibacter sp.]
MKRIPVFILLFFLLKACSNSTNTGAHQADSMATMPSGKQTNDRKETTLNNIVLEKITGFKITSAFLADEKGNLLHPQNTIPAGYPVFLTIRIQDGWTLQKGYASPGASQAILTHNNEPVLQSRDLFANIPRVKKEDAGTIRLKTLITATRSDIRHYTIRFRVWDKWGEGEITGHYRLQVKP